MANNLCECGCGQPVGLAPYNLKRLGWVKGNPKRYIKGHNSKGSNNPFWNGGRYKDNQGRWVLNVNGEKKLEHRLVMEQILGRPLKPYEIVHHKNGDPSDNRPENLEIYIGQGQHTSLAHYGYAETHLLLKLRHYYHVTGRLPTRKALENTPWMPNGKTYYNRFGSFQNALKEAGLV